MAYVVNLSAFDGPLDLLLSLISRAQVDITEIFVSEITEQYLESMAGVDALDMDSASEFLQMAATLLEIKSRALLPKPPKAEPEAESPEAALIRQLTEYKAFKAISEQMRDFEAEAREVLTKLPEEFPLPPPTIELTGLTLEGLTRAFAQVLQRWKARAESAPLAGVRREIVREPYTVSGCMAHIQRRVRKGPVAFHELFEDLPTRQEIITLFLALLELLRLNRISAAQEQLFGEIMLTSDARPD